MATPHISAPELSELTGVRREKVRTLLRGLEHQVGARGAKLYPAPSALRLILAPDSMDPGEARAARDHETALLARERRRQLEGNAIDAEDVSAFAGNLAVLFRVGAEAIPGRVASRVASELGIDATPLRVALDRECAAVLERIASEVEQAEKEPDALTEAVGRAGAFDSLDVVGESADGRTGDQSAVPA